MCLDRRFALTLGSRRVYQAVHPETHRVAACKVVAITPETSDWQMKAIEKECRVHTALKHKHILELIGAAKLSIEQAARGGYLPAFYLLMEIAAGGDLFDKIGRCASCGLWGSMLTESMQYPMSASTRILHNITSVR